MQSIRILLAAFFSFLLLVSSYSPSYAGMTLQQKPCIRAKLSFLDSHVPPKGSPSQSLQQVQVTWTYNSTAGRCANWYSYVNGDPVNYIDPSGYYEMYPAEQANYPESGGGGGGWSGAGSGFAGGLSGWLAAWFTKDKEDDSCKCTNRKGGGKNAPHGKQDPPPSLLAQLDDLKDKLKKATSRRDKIKIRNKIENIKKEIDKKIKGETHSITPKGNQ